MMRAGLSLLVVSALVLAGCAEEPAKTDDQKGDKNKAPAQTTDVFHLLREPKTTLVAPNGTPTIEIPLFSGVAPLYTTTPLVWSYEFQNDSELEGGVAIFHIRVAEKTAHLGPGFCTFMFDSYVNENPGGDDRQCDPRDPGPIEGEYDVEFSFDIGDVEAEDELFIVLQTFTSSTQNKPTLMLLTGSEEFDSRVEIEGMNETIPAASAM